MLFLLKARALAKAPAVYNNQIRSFWEYINKMFNEPDMNRIKLLGPDRACAEWILRNGGSVIWDDGKKIVDYNTLPPEPMKVKKILEIDASDSGISHYGFPHLEGCSVKKIKLHNCSYIDDRAIKNLSYGKHSLEFVQISQCANITDDGLKQITVLKNLQNLVLFNLDGVTNLSETSGFIKNQLPKCQISNKM